MTHSGIDKTYLSPNLLQNEEFWCTWIHTQQYTAQARKIWDMRHHWLRDKETHQIIRVFLKIGLTNYDSNVL